MDGWAYALAGAEGGLAFLAAFILLGKKTAAHRHLSFDVPKLPAGSRHQRRGWQRRCLAELPELLDILSLGLSAGLSFDASVELFCERQDSELSHALRSALFSWRSGLEKRSTALESLAEEMGSPAFGRFASAVEEALAFGSPLASVLEAQGKLLRDEERLAAEERIEKVPIKMLIPLGTLVVPAMLLAILGPLLGSQAQLI